MGSALGKVKRYGPTKSMGTAGNDDGLSGKFDIHEITSIGRLRSSVLKERVGFSIGWISSIKRAVMDTAISAFWHAQPLGQADDPPRFFFYEPLYPAIC